MTRLQQGHLMFVWRCWRTISKYVCYLVPRPLDVWQKVFKILLMTTRDTQCIIFKRENFGVLRHVFWRKFSNQRNRQIPNRFWRRRSELGIWGKDYSPHGGLITMQSSMFSGKSVVQSHHSARRLCRARSAAARWTLPRCCVRCMFVLRLFTFRALVPCLQLFVVWLLLRSCVSFVVCCSIRVSGGEGEGKKKEKGGRKIGRKSAPRSGILFASPELMHRPTSNSPRHLDTRNV